MTESINGQTPIAFQPADVEALKGELKLLFNQFPTLAALSKDDSPIDSLPGQYYSHTNVKQNSKLIGTVVPRNVVMNFLKEINVQITDEFGEIKANGLSFNKFENYIKGTDIRTQYVISNLITAATDDAKERLLSKLGYVKPAISVVETMVGLGMSLHTATMLVNTPIIRQALQEEDLSQINKAIKELKNVPNIKTLEVSDSMLENSINESAVQDEELAILNLFEKVNKVRVFIDQFIPVFNLTTGFGKDFSSLQIKKEAIEGLGLRNNFDSKTMPFKIGDSISEHWISGYIDVYDDFTKTVLPTVFITQTDSFKEMYDAVNAYSKFYTSESKDKLQKNILSYVTMKAYMHDILNNKDISDAIGGSLMNSFIYPQADTKNVVKLIADLRTKYKGTGNYFLDYYLFSQESTDASNSTGLNILTTRSFGKLSDNEKVRIQNGFHQLYGESETRADAVNIIHYAMIKDGLQYDYGSIIDALVPFTMENYLNSSKKAFEVFKSERKAEDVFGISLEELKYDLAMNYGQSASHSNNLFKMNPNNIFNNPSSDFKYSETKLEGQITFTKNDKSKTFEFPTYMYLEDSLMGIKTYYRIEQASLGKEDVRNERAKGKVLADKVTYVPFELKGSYKQNAIGFMFDGEGFERPYTKDLKTFVLQNKNVSESNDFEELNKMVNPQAESKLAALNNSKIIANENEISVDGMDVSEAEPSVEIMNKFENFIKGSKTNEDPVVEVIQSERSEINQLKLDLKLDSNNDKLVDFYDQFISGNKQNKVKLKESGIGTTLESFAKSFENSNFTEQEDFIEDVKTCHLGL